MLVKLFFYIGCTFIFTACLNKEESNRRDLAKTATEINEKCPKMLDSETRLDGIEVKEPNTLVYRYTLMNVLSQNVDTVRFYRMLWPGIISNVKLSAEMKKLREANTVIEYFYQDKNSIPIYTFHINPEAYK
ncbi:hypothetical protein [Aurantibacillus circumpalustris]|uniref:hypothetical protein n=1 Tax=Aurantibacillus circumpalustris TaxID=3036359 RepID=UPI00295AB6B8|nr:hypothetical protein [Aurantibacillus circumpalustris]